MSTAAIKPRPTTEDDITVEVLRRFDSTEDPRRDEVARKFGVEPPFCTCEFDFVLAPAQ